MKYKYPFAFYTPLLSSESDLQPIIREAKHIGITVNTPDVNKSQPEFTTAGDELQYGLLSVKYVGDKAANEILKRRPFKSVDDFRERCQARACGKRVVENLLSAGAFDNI